MSFKSNLKSQEIEETLQNVLRKDNTEEFVPTSDYQPATKKYVDDLDSVVIFDTIDDMNAQRESISAKIVAGTITSIFIKDILGAEPSSGNKRPMLFRPHDIVANGMIISLISYWSPEAEVEGDLFCNILQSSYQSDYVLSSYALARSVTCYDLAHDNISSPTIIPGDTDTREYIEQNKLIIKGSGTACSNMFLYPISSVNEEDSDGSCKLVLTAWDIQRGKYIQCTKAENGNSHAEVDMPRYRVLTESEYSALGETVNTDNVLYFVTPDAE